MSTALAIPGCGRRVDRTRPRRTSTPIGGGTKRDPAMNRLRLRGLPGAKDEFLMLAAVRNPKRPAKRAAIPPPRHLPA